ncbi:MAG: TIGR03862 family flavoprotein [Paracoccaceae bacterium]
MTDALVIGAGPAGLMAAYELAKAGRQVVVVDAKPSVGRKLLMAGKSGLNLTKDEAYERFLPQFGDSAGRLGDILTAFDNSAVQDWARDLGQPVFTGSSGRVFPKAMKSSPLLRAWLGQLSDLGVAFRTRWHWQGWQDGVLQFSTPAGPQTLSPAVTVLALGGASWSRLGSDGLWAPWLAGHGVELAPFAAANAGLVVDWTPHMARHFGQPVKGVGLSVGAVHSRGEFVVTQAGLEGGGVYTVSAALRTGAPLMLDLMPDWPLERIATKLRHRKSKTTLTNHLRKALQLTPVKLALLQEFAHPLPTGDALAKLIKALPVKYTGLAPMDGAISTAGGVAWGAVDSGLMLNAVPGVFVAGEMLDWEAPTGGYLLTGCLATGKWAGRHGAHYI